MNTYADTGWCSPLSQPVSAFLQRADGALPRRAPLAKGNRAFHSFRVLRIANKAVLRHAPQTNHEQQRSK